jgi:ABC-type lipoprotein release transport system permease subunit
MGFNVSSIVKNISSIGLLQAIGFEKKYIIFSYVFYGIFIATLGFFVSLLIFNVLLFLDTNYHLMNYIFDPSIYFHFDLRLSNHILIRIFLLDILLISLSTLYPLYKISKLDIIDSIKNRV